MSRSTWKRGTKMSLVEGEKAVSRAISNCSRLKIPLRELTFYSFLSNDERAAPSRNILL